MCSRPVRPYQPAYEHACARGMKKRCINTTSTDTRPNFGGMQALQCCPGKFNILC